MRLADIYLMYAEACAAFGGASGKATNFSKTAEDAINTLRDRCGAGHDHDLHNVRPKPCFCRGYKIFTYK